MTEQEYLDIIANLTEALEKSNAMLHGYVANRYELVKQLDGSIKSELVVDEKSTQYEANLALVASAKALPQ